MLRARLLASATVSLALLAAGVTGCSSSQPAAERADLAGAVPTTTAAADPSAGPAASVLEISVDGLNPDAIRQLGETGAPTFHRMLAQGAGTLNARTEFEQTVTLPNHTSMLTSRRIDAARGGHGVTWDDDRPGMTVQRAAGHAVASVFTVVHADGGSTALYSTKEKFSLYQRSWPRGIDRFTVDENQQELVSLVRADLLDGAPTYTFLHVSLPDRTGHEYGGMSAPYVDAVHRTDRQLGTLLRAISRTEALRASVTVVLTADHGFAPGVLDHSARRNPANYTIPFLVWGAGVDHDDLYALNSEVRDPGTRRPAYAGRQPVRNGDAANLATTLLGLPPLTGSELDRTQTLRVAR